MQTNFLLTTRKENNVFILFFLFYFSEKYVAFIVNVHLTKASNSRENNEETNKHQNLIDLDKYDVIGLETYSYDKRQESILLAI